MRKLEDTVRRREPALEFEFPLELFDLHEADVAPGSDEVGDDDNRGPCGLFVLAHICQYKAAEAGKASAPLELPKAERVRGAPESLESLGYVQPPRLERPARAGVGSG